MTTRNYIGLTAAQMEAYKLERDIAIESKKILDLALPLIRWAADFAIKSAIEGYKPNATIEEIRDHAISYFNISCEHPMMQNEIEFLTAYLTERLTRNPAIMDD